MFNFTEPWYALSQEQQDEWERKLDQSHAQSGSKLLMTCFSRWSGAATLCWGVEAYPSFEALMKRSALLNEMDWYNFTSTESVLGVPFTL